ncbi:putative membrane protein [Conyzicola lurida]|uniref:Putative membrane protein n=1 Tax=Conyzicola lurida TaxID=1172621 RepID=A0A841AI08_9MICO|nr:small multidrug efflux protein [Conyzicola lurida]MBB5842064.1 putative membrane protein [Conyzicola lurida]
MDLIATFQDLVAQVPEFVQPLIVALAGAVPFVEGEGATTIGIIGGLNPVVAVVSAAIGNFLSVLVLVLLSSGARSAIVNRRSVRETVPATGGTRLVSADESLRAMEDDYAVSDRKAARKAKFQRALDRYGVPGVSLLGPLLLPTQFTSTMLVGVGVHKARVLFWQAIAIVLWSTLFGVVVGGVLHNAG